MMWYEVRPIGARLALDSQLALSWLSADSQLNMALSWRSADAQLTLS